MLPLPAVHARQGVHVPGLHLERLYGFLRSFGGEEPQTVRGTSNSNDIEFVPDVLLVYVPATLLFVIVCSPGAGRGGTCWAVPHHRNTRDAVGLPFRAQRADLPQEGHERRVVPRTPLILVFIPKLFISGEIVGLSVEPADEAPQFLESRLVSHMSDDRPVTRSSLPPLARGAFLFSLRDK